MALIEFDQNKPMDIVLLVELLLILTQMKYIVTLDKVRTFTMYVGGSPANIAVGVNKLGKKVGFIGAVSDDQFGDFIINFFNDRGIDTTQIVRAKNGEKLRSYFH